VIAVVGAARQHARVYAIPHGYDGILRIHFFALYYGERTLRICSALAPAAWLPAISVQRSTSS
jgi:hypothetical protein